MKINITIFNIPIFDLYFELTEKPKEKIGFKK